MARWSERSSTDGRETRPGATTRSTAQRRHSASPIGPSPCAPLAPCLNPFHSASRRYRPRSPAEIPTARPSTCVSSRPRRRLARRRRDGPAPGASAESAASRSSGTVCRIRRATSSSGGVRDATSSGALAGGCGSSAPRSASHRSRSLLRKRRCPPAVLRCGTFPPAAHARSEDALTPKKASCSRYRQKRLVLASGTAQGFLTSRWLD